MLICASDAMHVKFSSELFGISSDSEPFTELENAPVFNEENENWEFSCVLGECGMKFSQANKQLTWGMTFRHLGQNFIIDIFGPCKLGNFRHFSGDHSSKILNL